MSGLSNKDLDVLRKRGYIVVRLGKWEVFGVRKLNADGTTNIIGEFQYTQEGLKRAIDRVDIWEKQ